MKGRGRRIGNLEGDPQNNWTERKDITFLHELETSASRKVFRGIKESRKRGKGGSKEANECQKERRKDGRVQHHQ